MTTILCGSDLIIACCQEDTESFPFSWQEGPNTTEGSQNGSIRGAVSWSITQLHKCHYFGINFKGRAVLPIKKSKTVLICVMELFWLQCWSCFASTFFWVHIILEKQVILNGTFTTAGIMISCWPQRFYGRSEKGIHFDPLNKPLNMALWSDTVTRIGQDFGDCSSVNRFLCDLIDVKTVFNQEILLFPQGSGGS